MFASTTPATTLPVQRGRINRKDAASAPQPSTTLTPPTPPERSMLRAEDLARRWRVSPKTLERWRREGDGPHYLKLGGRVSYPLDKVIEFEQDSTRKSTSRRAP